MFISFKLKCQAKVSIAKFRILVVKGKYEITGVCKMSHFFGCDIIPHAFAPKSVNAFSSNSLKVNECFAKMLHLQRRPPASCFLSLTGTVLCRYATLLDREMCSEYHTHHYIK